jgi:tRNA(fMet)-specific endonuclease VapC
VPRYLLDTSAVSRIIRDDSPAIRRRLLGVPMHELCISAVTRGELRYGLAKRGNPEALSQRVNQFLLRIDTLAWTSDVADCYGVLRSSAEGMGNPLGPLDMMIAAHAVATRSILVTGDRAFARLSGSLKLEDWST